MKTDEKNCCLKATQFTEVVTSFDRSSSLMLSSSTDESPGKR